MVGFEQGSNELVIKIRDEKTGEIVKQIPEEEFLRLTNRISDFNKSILDQTVWFYNIALSRIFAFKLKKVPSKIRGHFLFSAHQSI